jgi:hypothetical protein
MKNIIIIFLLVFLFFGMVFAAYITAFKMYFTSERLTGRAKQLTRMTFQRDITVSKIALHPFGFLKVQNFAMAAKGGFKNGTLISVDKITSKIMLLNLIRREIVLKNFYIDGVNLRLNYENKRKFDYDSFFSNLKFVFMQSGKRMGIVKKIEILPVFLNNGTVNLFVDAGNIKFNKIVLTSAMFGSKADFEGDVVFEFEFDGAAYPSSFKFAYNNEARVLRITEFTCEKFLLKANGVIGFLERGKISLNFDAVGSNVFFENVLKKITGGLCINDADLSSGDMKSVNIFYSNEIVNAAAA